MRRAAGACHCGEAVHFVVFVCKQVFAHRRLAAAHNVACSYGRKQFVSCHGNAADIHGGEILAAGVCKGYLGRMAVSRLAAIAYACEIMAVARFFIRKVDCEAVGVAQLGYGIHGQHACVVREAERGGVAVGIGDSEMRHVVAGHVLLHQYEALCRLVLVFFQRTEIGDKAHTVECEGARRWIAKVGCGRSPVIMDALAYDRYGRATGDVPAVSGNAVA